jgi:hypothetical protein
MTGAVYARTPNLGLGLIEFNFPNWADDANDNTKILDAGFSAIGISVKGAWTNSTPYNIGDLVVDTDTNSLWRANVDHISAPYNSFEDDRLANPLYWTDASLAIHARGLYTSATTYYPNDVMYRDVSQYTWAMATRQFVSTTWDNDLAENNIVIIFDASQAATDSANSAIAAAGSATNAANSASAANTSASNASNSAVAAGNSASAAASSATSASISASSAATSANSAAASLAAMLPDAPHDNKYYGRYNESWQLVLAEAPTDGIVYSRKSGNWVPSTGAMLVADAAPSPPLANGTLWFESDTGNTFMWYQDSDSSQWIHISGFTALVPGGGGGISEAPTDGLIYARRNNAWLQIGASGGVPEAPLDGKQYVRQNGAWVEVNVPVLPPMPFSFDPANGDAILKFGSSTVVRIKASGLILTKDDVEVFSVSV